MSTSAPTARAVLYLRVSTKEQAERGGEAEGFSIPAQREAGIRKAQSLQSYVVSEFVDAGESARSADRPELQRMLEYLAANKDVQYVIVHKVDRLARSRSDDVAINLAIRQAGATLVSCTENIDETPSGMLLHGIMSSIAEFYSRNLATEVAKGMSQKAQAGGTPTLAPLGYRNTRVDVDGREVRTVALDHEDNRAELVRWAFHAYATGDWSYRGLATELEARGLTQRATAKRAKRPLEAKKVGSILQNPYYIGIVTYKGLQFDGKHEPLVSADVFQQVQLVIEAHRLAGERSYRHKSYLAGSLFCNRCRSKLLFSVSRGRSDNYGYWFCAGRHAKSTSCDLPYLAEELVEDAVVRHWHYEQLDADVVVNVEAGLLDDLKTHHAASKRKAAQLDRRISIIQQERAKWAEKAILELVPDDIARTKQRELTAKLGSAEADRSTLLFSDDGYEKAIRVATEMLRLCGDAYARGNEQLRREWNQTWFEAIFIDDDHGDPTVNSVRHTPFFAAARTAQVFDVPAFHVVSDDPQNEEEPDGLGHRVLSLVDGSNVPLLVGEEGLEPSRS